MLKNPAKIEELFRDTLLSDEEIYWMGAPLHNFWHFKGRYFFYIFVVLLCIPVLLFALLVIKLGFSVAIYLLSRANWEILFGTFYISLAMFASFGKVIDKHIILYLPEDDNQKQVYWWKPSYYAITNRRVLIFEQGNIRDYWYHLLDAPILKKPKNRAASIQLYSSTYAAKKKKTPVLDTLRGIPENEADDAFAILKQAREEALEERKQKMGRG